MIKNAPLLIVAVLVCIVMLPACASKSDMEAVKGEIGVLKGDMEKLKSALAAQVQDLKVLQANLEASRQETKELKEAMRAAPEKAQNKATGAKPKAKKRRR